MMHTKRIVFVIAVVCVLAFAVGPALAKAPFRVNYIVKYDAYLQRLVDGNVVADTLIVVNNARNARSMKVWIQVYDKHGNPVNVYGVPPNEVHGETLYDGGSPLVGGQIPANGFGWITMGMMVPRITQDPWEFQGRGEKFTFKVFTQPKDMPPIVEVKQVIYTSGQQYPGEAIWNTDLIKTWSEAALGGLNSVGVVKTQFGPPDAVP
jgi:hypothetical protein